MATETAEAPLAWVSTRQSMISQTVVMKVASPSRIEDI